MLIFLSDILHFMNRDDDIFVEFNFLIFHKALRVSSFVVCETQHGIQRNFKYLRWHLRSMLRFLTSAQSRQIQRLKRLKR